MYLHYTCAYIRKLNLFILCIGSGLFLSLFLKIILDFFNLDAF